MSKRLGLLAGLLLVWALFWLRFTPSAPQRVRPEPASPAPPAITPERNPAPTTTAKPQPPAASAQPKAQPTAQPDRYRETLMRLIAEQRKRNDARLAVAEKRWPREQRQEPWASQREAELRAAFERDQIDVLIGSLQCRATLCRIELQAQDSNAAVAVNQARNLQAAVGPQVALAMTRGGLDRTAVLYTARAGESFDR